jgi:hypothetical protein
MYSNAAVIGNDELLLAILYPESLTSSIYTRLSNAFLIGMIVGMLMFGVVADQLGRKTGAVATTALLVLGIVLSTAAKGENETGMFWMLIIARGIAGVGAGGEYPVSGAGATEASDENKTMRKHRGFMFAMIADLSASLGYVFGGLVPLLLLLCVGQKKEHYEIVWRLSFALGLIPPVSIFWFRYKMAVSTAYRKASMRRQKVPYILAIKRYWRPLLGASSTWFLYNWIAIVSYTAFAHMRAYADPILALRYLFRHHHQPRQCWRLTYHQSGLGRRHQLLLHPRSIHRRLPLGQDWSPKDYGSWIRNASRAGLRPRWSLPQDCTYLSSVRGHVWRFPHPRRSWSWLDCRTSIIGKLPDSHSRTDDGTVFGDFQSWCCDRNSGLYPNHDRCRRPGGILGWIRFRCIGRTDSILRDPRCGQETGRRGRELEEVSGGEWMGRRLGRQRNQRSQGCCY